jgi:hypothetical protein
VKSFANLNKTTRGAGWGVPLAVLKHINRFILQLCSASCRSIFSFFCFYEKTHKNVPLQWNSRKFETISNPLEKAFSTLWAKPAQIPVTLSLYQQFIKGWPFACYFGNSSANVFGGHPTW